MKNILTAAACLLILATQAQEPKKNSVRIEHGTHFLQYDFFTTVDHHRVYNDKTWNIYLLYSRQISPVFSVETGIGSKSYWIEAHQRRINLTEELVFQLYSDILQVPLRLKAEKHLGRFRLGAQAGISYNRETGGAIYADEPYDIRIGARNYTLSKKDFIQLEPGLTVNYRLSNRFDIGMALRDAITLQPWHTENIVTYSFGGQQNVFHFNSRGNYLSIGLSVGYNF